MYSIYINRDTDIHRRDAFLRRAIFAGLEFERLSAVTPSDFNSSYVSVLQARRLPRGWTPLQLGEISCFFSHQKAWEAVVQSGRSWAFIVEDDVHFSADTSKVLCALSAMTSDADVVKLETYKDEVEVRNACLPIEGGIVLRELLSKHVGSAAYAISINGARKLLTFARNHIAPVDLVLFDIEKFGTLGLRVYQADPACCIQENRLFAECAEEAWSSIAQSGQRSAFSRSGAFVLPRKILREVRRGGEKSKSFLRRLAGYSIEKIIPFADQA